MENLIKIGRFNRVQLGANSNLDEQNQTVIKDGDFLYIRTVFNSTEDIVQKLNIEDREIAYSPQYTTYVISNTAEDTVLAYESGTLIHIAPDDGAPVKLDTTYIGAAHGLSNLRTVTCTSHGKTNEDVGSEWLDDNSKKHYIVKIVDADTIWTLAENVHTDWYPRWYMQSYITGNLTHSKDATHTGAMTLASVSAGQMLPAIKNKTHTVKLNGTRTITENGIYQSATVVVEENYEVVNPSDTLQHLIDNVGNANDPVINTGSVMFTQKNKFTYDDKGNCLLYNEFTPKQAVTYDYFGSTQSSPLYVNGALSKLKQYIPKSLPIILSSTEFDFRTLPDINSLPATLNLTDTYWEEATEPPERFTQFLANSSDELQVGFQLGYLKGKGLETDRVDYVDKAFSMSTAKKQYPYAIDSKITPVIDTVYSMYTFRSYFSCSEFPTGRTALNYITEGNDVYMYIDYNAIISDTISIPTELVGKYISILDKSDNVAISSTQLGESLSVEVTTNTPMYGYAILKLTSTREEIIIPVTDFDLYGRGYTSNEIDTWFNSLAELDWSEVTDRIILVVVGNSNPTSASSEARGVLVNIPAIHQIQYNEGFTQ